MGGKFDGKMVGVGKEHVMVLFIGIAIGMYARGFVDRRSRSSDEGLNLAIRTKESRSNMYPRRIYAEPEMVHQGGFIALPAAQYKQRASLVHEKRSMTWTRMRSLGEMCDEVRNRCSLDLYCCGTKKVCVKQVHRDGICDGVQLRCEHKLECINGKCTDPDVVNVFFSHYYSVTINQGQDGFKGRKRVRVKVRKKDKKKARKKSGLEWMMY